MISRYRSRFEFEWRARSRRGGAAIGAVPLVVLALAVAFGGLAANATARGSASATRWLARAQNTDGGFPASPGGPSSAAITGWAALGLEAAGRNPLDIRSGGHSAAGFLRTHLDGVRSTGDLERTILALDGAGVVARRFGGRDLVAELRRRRSRTGSFEGQVNLTAFGILALRAAGAPASGLRRSAAWLRRAQNGDGGWGFQPNAGSDPDSTGAALQGLAAGGQRGQATRRGAAYLRRSQQHGGGFALAGASASNSQSTAWAIQGLVAAGANPAAVRKSGRSAFDYLSHRQAADGHYRYSAASDQTPIWVTGQALLAVNGEALPLAPVARAKGRGGPSTGASEGAGASSDATGAHGQARPDTSRGGASGDEAAGTADAGGGGAPAGAAAGGRVAARPLSAPIPEGDPSGGGGAGATTAYVAGGLAALAMSLAAGFLWYRRRLP
jgi:hypothetical protein